MTTEFINWAVAKIVSEINWMEQIQRQNTMKNIQESEGFVSTIEISLPRWMDEYAQFNGRDSIKVSFIRGASIIIHQALRAHFAQELLAK